MNYSTLDRARAEFRNIHWPNMTIPIPPMVNPLWQELEHASTAWVRDMGLMDMPHSAHCMKVITPEFLGACFYPLAGIEGLKFGGDLMAFFYIIDDYGEQMETGDKPSWWLSLEEEMHAALASDESVANHVAEAPQVRAMLDLLRRGSKRMSAAWCRRFRRHSLDYFDSYYAEAVRRGQGVPDETVSYVKLRQATSSIFVCADAAECAMGVEIPEDLYESGIFQSMVMAINHLLGWSNDFHGFVKEVVDDRDVNNLVAAVMQSSGRSLQESIDLAFEMWHAQLDAFLHQERLVNLLIESSSYSQSRKADLHRCVEAYRYLIPGHEHWAKVTVRYARESQPEHSVARWKQHATKALLATS